MANRSHKRILSVTGHGAGVRTWASGDFANDLSLPVCCQWFSVGGGRSRIVDREITTTEIGLHFAGTGFRGDCACLFQIIIERLLYVFFYCSARPTLLTVSNADVVGMQHNFSLLQFCLCLIIRLGRYMQVFRFYVPCARHASHTHKCGHNLYLMGLFIALCTLFNSLLISSLWIVEASAAVRRAKVQSKLSCHWRFPLCRCSSMIPMDTMDWHHF